MGGGFRSPIYTLVGHEPPTLSMSSCFHLCVSELTSSSGPSPPLFQPGTAVLLVSFPVKMQSYSNFPEEIISDILSRLPAKSVGRFRCVSKAWQALLSQPRFIRTHLDLSKNFLNPSLLLTSYAQSSVFYATLNNPHHLFDEITFSVTKASFADYPDIEGQIQASCDGLVLVTCCFRMFVINPVTREIRELPPFPFVLDHPCNSIFYGFGYDSVHDDYKVVAISRYDKYLEPRLYDEDDSDDEDDDNAYELYCPELSVNIYSLKTGTWKRAESFPYGYHYIPWDGVFIEGAIHWVAYRTTDHKFTIVAFDLVQEKFCEVPCPSSDISDSYLVHYITVLHGRLCVYDDYGTHIWVMRQYGVQESWTNIKVNHARPVSLWPLCMWGEEHVLINRGKLMCNLREGTLKNIVFLGVEKALHVVSSFVESLVLPHGTNETREEGKS